MDLSSFKSIATSVAFLQVEGPDGVPLTYTAPDGSTLPCRIGLLSQDSAEYVRVSKDQVTAMGAKLGKRGQATITGDSAEKDKIDLLVAVTKSWEGFDDDGKPYEFNKKNCRALYERYGFIRDQVHDFVHTRGNFLAGN
jgi:hypothetical protein